MYGKMVLFQDKILNIEKERKGTMCVFFLFFFFFFTKKSENKSGILKFPMCKNPGRMFFAQGQQTHSKRPQGRRGNEERLPGYSGKSLYF